MSNRGNMGNRNNISNRGNEDEGTLLTYVYSYVSTELLDIQDQLRKYFLKYCMVASQ